MEAVTSVAQDSAAEAQLENSPRPWSSLAPGSGLGESVCVCGLFICCYVPRTEYSTQRIVGAQEIPYKYPTLCGAYNISESAKYNGEK